MTTPQVFTDTLKTLKTHSPEILTAVSVSGVLTTSYLAAKAGLEAGRVIDEDEAIGGVAANRKQRIKERAKHTWRLYVPAAISGVVTVAAIVGASKAQGKRTTVAVAAYSLTEKAFSEYKEKVVEQIGPGKEQKVQDEVARSKVAKNPAKDGQVVILGTGNVLCCELYTGRYFRSDHETLRKAVNDVNAKINRERYVTLDEFYDIMGLRHTCDSDAKGWDSDRQLELRYSSVLNEDGEPCLAFEYNYVKPI